MKQLIECCVWLTILTISIATAETYVYKWTDENGLVNYTEAPPKNVTSEKISVKTGEKIGKLTSNTPKKTEQKNNDDTESTEPQPDAETQAKYKEDFEKTCSTLKQNIEQMSSKGRVRYQPSDGGEPFVLSEEQRAKELARQQAKYEKYCKAS